MSLNNIKICTKCGEEKEITQFYKNGQNGSVRGMCKDYCNLRMKEYHKLRSKTGYYVYRLIHNKVVIYIGKTTNLDRRIKEHSEKRNFSYVEYLEFNTEVDMTLCEYYFINRCKPIENKQDLASSHMMQIKELDDLVWNDYSLINNLKISQIKKEIDKAYDSIEDTIARIDKLKKLLEEEIYRIPSEDLRINKEKVYVLEDVNLPKEYKNMDKTILAFTVDGVFLGEFKSGMDASRALGTDDGSVYKCCTGVRKSHKGYTFRYNFEL